MVESGAWREHTVNLEAAVKAYGPGCCSTGCRSASRRATGSAWSRQRFGRTTRSPALVSAVHLSSGRSTRAATPGSGYLRARLAGTVREVVFGTLPEHEWAADARGGLLAALLTGIESRETEALSGGRRRSRSPPCCAEVTICSCPRADQPPGYRGDQVAGRIPHQLRPGVRGGDATAGSRRVCGAPGRSPTGCTCGAASRPSCWQNRAGQAGRRAGPAQAQPAPQRTRVAAARACSQNRHKPRFRIDAATA